MKPPAQLKARVMSAAAREAAPVRRTVERRRAFAWIGAGLWMFLVFGGVGGLRAVERPVAFVLGTAAGWAAIALAATWGSSRGGSMLGRPRNTLLSLIIMTPIALVCWYAAWVGRSGVAGEAPADLAILPCMLVTLTMGLAPFALLLLGRRGSDPVHPRATAAAIGVVSGAWGAVLIDMHCERVDLLHVALGHVVPALLLGLAGFLVGGSWLGVRAEPKGRLKPER